MVFQLRGDQDLPHPGGGEEGQQTEGGRPLTLVKIVREVMESKESEGTWGSE